MDPRRLETYADVGLFAAVVVVAVIWASALRLDLLGLTAILAVVVLVMLGFIAGSLLYISHKLSGRYDRIIQAILRNRKECLPPGWRPTDITGTWGFALDRGGSFILFFVVFLFYFLVMIVFFYGLGGQPLADPYRLMIAAFLGTSALHFSGHIKGGTAPKVVLEFLVPFGIIVGLIDLSVIGPYTLLSLGGKYLPVALLFFSAYYGLDAVVEWYVWSRGSQTTGNTTL